MNKPYKLIAHLPEDQVAPLPFYCYTVEDPEGKELGSFTKAIFTLEPDKAFCGKLTLHRKWIALDKDDNVIEEVIEDVDAEIEVRQLVAKTFEKIKGILTPKEDLNFRATKTVIDGFDNLSEDEKRKYANSEFIHSVLTGMEQSVPFYPEDDQDKIKQLLEQFKGKVAKYKK